MFKKRFPIIILLSVVLLFNAGCSGSEQFADSGATLLFSQLYETNGMVKEVSPIVSALDGATVSIKGFMAQQSPLDNSFVYLLNIPFMACPFCTISNTDTMEIISIYKENNRPVFYTQKPVMVTGRLEVQQKIDEFGYVTQFRIYASDIKILNETKNEREISSYYLVLNETGAINILILSSINTDSYLNSRIMFDSSKTYNDKFNYLSYGIQPQHFKQWRESMEQYRPLILNIKPVNDQIKEYHNSFIELFDTNMKYLDELFVLTNEKNNLLDADDETKKFYVDEYIRFIHAINQSFENYIRWNNLLRENN